MARAVSTALPLKESVSRAIPIATSRSAEYVLRRSLPLTEGRPIPMSRATVLLLFSRERAVLSVDPSITTAMALTLSADRTRRVALELFEQAGIEAILLKGPTLQWAWEPEPRHYTDVDLLVPHHHHAAAVRTLVAADFASRRTLDASGHATTLDRDGHAAVDLHWTLAVSGVSPALTWAVLRDHAHVADEGGLWLDRAASAAVAVLHAAQTRRGTAKLERDVDALIDDLSTVRSALVVADDLMARPAFALGLSITPGGVVAGEILGVDAPTRSEVVKHAEVAGVAAVRRTLRRRDPRGAVRLIWPKAADLPERAGRPLWRLRRLAGGVRSSLMARVRR